jgi:Protein of unknown function (DUF1592)/Protein of unknown function (DUF1588)/Protein of unknown function (DUF1587)/Protein of unknown function (DUF1585)/Protein of unknown function (DUF1595)/Planctomycete cytochrome C
MANTARFPTPGRLSRWLTLVLLATVGGCAESTDPESQPDPLPAQSGTADSAGDLERAFARSVQPFLQTYCVSCHGPEKHKAELDLSIYKNWNAVAKDHRQWERILERLRAGEMPPESAKQHPPADVRREVIAWIEDVRTYEADRNAGDPGSVPPRRLSNAEYNYTIRDLTGVDIRPTRDFPVDPANEAGFDNSAESLTTSPALVKKYLEAARKVADHLVLAPDGLEFAPHPVVADTDRDKFCVNRIVNFYRRQRTDYADYFLAAWKFKNRAALGRTSATMPELAAELGISPKYLATIWSTLTQKSEGIGPIAALQALWSELPEGGTSNEDAARSGCQRMRDFVVDLRAKLVPSVKNLTAPKIHNGSQPLVLWKNRQFAANRMHYAGGAFKVHDLRLPAGSAAAKAMNILLDPDEARRYESTFERFCATFPDAFFVSERARVYLDPEKEKKLTGRLLSAGFHSQMGYFRDDGPLYELLLDDHQRQELDRLWLELDFVASAPIRQYTGFIWFDRTDSSYMRSPEFDSFRAEDKDCISADKVRRLAEAYLAKAERAGASEVALTAIRDYFKSMGATFRLLEKVRAEAEPKHLAALLQLAERAYRRPLSPPEREGLTRFYRSLREQDGLGHEDAIRDSVVSVLMSPYFCFRVDLPGPGAGSTRSLTDNALASRLSYFLWSSLPDKELHDHAAAGNLRRPEVLVDQVRRMLRDSRVRGLATEFGGNWLDFRRFEEHNAVDRGRFPAFDNDLRQAMFEEPIRFLVDLARRDGSILDLLYADHTFVNPILARHYGMPVSSGGADAWVRVDRAREYGRGGLLPMALFLTKNAPGLRTSPVKRGYWVVRRLLGEHIPPPPPTVPQLPADETSLGELTLRETLARHRADKSCAACHERFDSFGLVFEAYGPIGERRTRDLGGRLVDTKANFPGGDSGEGVAGLTDYIRRHRQQDFVDNLCRKLLAYALGRGLLLSDERLVRDMRVRLEANDFRFSSLVDTIVSSPQFLNKRGDASVATKRD